MRPIAKLFYAAMFAAVAVLGFTGIGVFLSGHAPMTHWVLMAHMAAAPIFALGLAGVAVTWAGLCRADSRPRLGCAARFLFWIILASGLVVILSGAVPMTPLFGSHGQHTLYLTHRWAGIVLAAAVLLHLPALRPRGV